jgi:molybdenum cofactor biosynthesis protein B
MKPRILTITVSDTRTASDDTAGKALADELSAFEIVGHERVHDDATAIAALVSSRANSGEIDALVLTGGTGIAPRDVTFEAVSALFNKTLEGFGEAFRRLSWDEIGPRAILSRATAGTVGQCLVFVLPGSEKGARLGARELIAPVLAHAIDLAHGRTRHGKPTP